MSKHGVLALSGVALLVLAMTPGCGPGPATTCTQASPPAYAISPTILLKDSVTTVPLGAVLEVRVACTSSTDWKTLSVHDTSATDPPGGVLQTLAIQAKGGNVFGEFRAVGVGQGIILPVQAHPVPCGQGGACAGPRGYAVIVQEAV